MAKVGNDPNSATSEFFINLADNSANLDHQNGGFTVFGKVLSGMDVVNQIATLPTTNHLSASMARWTAFRTKARWAPAASRPRIN